MIKKSFKAFLYLVIFFFLSQSAFALNIVKLSPGYYPNTSKGRPLATADIYVGIPDLDPEIVANQKTLSVQQEDGTVVAVSQPIHTNAGGVPVYAGSPVVLLVEGDYSLKVLDSHGSQIYYVPSTAYEKYLVSGNYYYPDYSEADQGVVGGGQTVTDILTEVGTTENATMYFSHDSGENTTTYIFTTNTTITSNFNIIIEDGAILDGAGTLTINGPFKAGLYQIFGATLTVSFGTNSVEKVYPEWWGIDGTNDDVEIELALASGTTNKIPVRLSQSYTLGGMIDIPTNSYLFSTNKATLTAKNGMDTSFFDIKGSNVVVDGLKIAGNAANQSAGNAFYCDTAIINVEVKNCNIDSVYGYGFQVAATVGGWKIHHNTFTNSGLAAYDLSRGAISFQTAADTFADIMVHHNTIDTCGAGIQFYSSGHSAITNIHTNFNTIIDVELVPIEYNSYGMDNSEIIGNIISGSGTNGISGIFSGSVVANNTIEDQSEYGIEFGGTGMVIKGNHINNCGLGIECSGASSSVLISGNEIMNTTAGVNHDGIRIAQSTFDKITIVGNLIVDPYITGIVVAGTGTLGDVTNLIIKNNNIIFKTARAACGPLGINIYDVVGGSIKGNTILTSVDYPATDWNPVINIVRKSTDIVISNNDIIGTGGSVIDHRGISISATPGAYSKNIFIRENTVTNFSIGIHTNATIDPHVQLKGNILEGCTTETMVDLSHKTERKDSSPTQGAMWYKGDQVWETAPAAGGVPGWVCVSRVKTEMRVAGVATNTIMEVDATAGMVAGDIIGVELDSGAWHWTTVASVTDGDTVVLTAGLPSAAAINNDVITNLWKTMSVLGA